MSTYLGNNEQERAVSWSRLKKWQPLIRKLARKVGAVNLIYTADDLEQETWIKVIKYWQKMAEYDDVRVEKTIKTIFKMHLIDIRRAQMIRPDTHWSFKSNVMDKVSQKISFNSNPTWEGSSEVVEGRLAKKPVSLPAGHFCGEIPSPEDTVLMNDQYTKLVDWVNKQEIENKEKLELAVVEQKSDFDKKLIVQKLQKFRKIKLILEAVADGNSHKELQMSEKSWQEAVEELKGMVA